jgi:hypothetical protein
MFRLSFDAKHKVLLSSFSGTYGADDITLRDNAVRRFVGRNGDVNGIMDFSAVDHITVSMDLLIQRSHQPPILHGQRVIVAPDEPALAYTRLVAAHQLYARRIEPALVRSMREAYGILGIAEPQFVAVAPDAAAGRERVLQDVLRSVDRVTSERTGGAPPGALQRLSGRLPSRSKHIALSDLFNAALGRNALGDAEIRTYCPSCRRASPLSWCRLVPGSTTAYLCPTCSAMNVAIAFVETAATMDPKGYVLGNFEIRSVAELHIAGVRLPASEC